ncbi:D-galacturonic acid binding lectin [Plakobranchus ocellatus]|uniref:D-galacturonic acid binding lectin n=1 Tax=Plakobranchus ocellatus TaxID=259542 RepID=A0AAV3YUW5_9GAST|nr:D-galacturonic acid binding lectin [Plakobranchus ocellatus]
MFRSSSILIISIFILLSLGKTSALFNARIPCYDCTIFPLESPWNNYYTESVPLAARVISMRHLTVKAGARPCVPSVSYGFNGANAWVDLGCKATFQICYVEGNTREVSCESRSGRQATCSIGDPPCQKLESVTIVRARSNLPCVRGFSYQADRSLIKVSKGCRAVFRIGCLVCRNR